MRSGKSRGFTLLEILVALAVLAVTLMAASRAIGMALQSTQQIKLRLLAEWVAQNRLATHRINQDWPAIGSSAGQETQGGIELSWVEEVSATPHPLFRRMDIRVTDPGDTNHELRHVIGYANKKAP